MAEVELECAVYGEGTVFPVKIARDAIVSALQEAIFDKKRYKKRYSFAASDLTLYLAKKDGAWLKSDRTFETFLKQGRHDDSGYEKMIPNWTLDDEDYFGDNSSLHAPAPEAALLQVILPHILANASTTLTERDGTFKERLCEYYGCFRRKKTWVRCMLLDVAFPRSLVIASHLFRRSNEYLSLAMMQISDIDDEKNGLLLFKPLEYALDHFQISFILDDSGVFRLKLFDPSIKDTRIVDLKDRKGNGVLTTEQAGVLLNSVSRARKACTFDVATTFGNVDGKPLVFTGLKRPFYRCLNLQARVAHMIALKKNRIDASYDFTDFWTEVSLDDKMEMFHRSIMNPDPAMF